MQMIYNRYNPKDVHRLIRDLRRFPLRKDKCHIDLGDDIFLTSTRARCYLNAMIFSVLDDYQIPKDLYRDFVFKGSILKGETTKYMNRMLKILEQPEVDFPHKEIFLTHALADIKMSFAYISLVTNDIVTADHSIYDYARLYRENEHFRKLFTEPIFLPTDSPWVIRRKTNEVIELFKNKTIDLPPLTDFLRYGVKANPEQIMMFFTYDIAPNFLNMKEALKPLGVGIVNGITSIWSIFVLDNIARLAIITGKNDVKITGTQSKRLAIALQNAKINMADTREMIDDCGATDYFEWEVLNKRDLEFFSYKYFVDPDTGEILGTITTERTDLIGKKIYIRSFIFCKAPVVCKTCYGYNWNMVADTPLYKGNFSLYVLQEFNKKMQQVISVKHHSGWVYTEMKVNYGGVDTTMDALIEEGNLFDKVEYDTVYVKPELSYEFIPHQVIENKDKKTYVKERLFIDGKEFITPQILRQVSDHVFSYSVPNDSVLLQADALSVAINKHSSKNRLTGKPDFDSTKLKGKSIPEQAKLMFEYEKSKVKLNHFIYYEAILYALIRDADDLANRPTAETKNIVLTHADHALTKPERTNNISTILPHGYINSIFNTINNNCQPSEMDILYQNVDDRKILKKNLFADFNAIINNATYIAKQNGVAINEKDANLTIKDMLDEELPDYYI